MIPREQPACAVESNQPIRLRSQPEHPVLVLEDCGATPQPRRSGPVIKEGVGRENAAVAIERSQAPTSRCSEPQVSGTIFEDPVQGWLLKVRIMTNDSSRPPVESIGTGRGRNPEWDHCGNA